jgi:hypothetical protein
VLVTLSDSILKRDAMKATNAHSNGVKHGSEACSLGLVPLPNTLLVMGNVTWDIAFGLSPHEHGMAMSSRELPVDDKTCFI